MKLLFALALLLHHPAFLLAASASSNSSSSSCPHNNATLNTTHLDFSLTSDPKKAITVNFAGQSLVSANATIKLQLLAKNEEVYSSEFDPCGSADVVAFCPLAEGPFDVTIARPVPAMLVISLNKADVGRISVEMLTSAGEVFQTCAQTDLASDAANNEGDASTPSSDSDGGNSSGNATESDGGSSNGSTSTNSTAPDNSNESSDSGASVVQQVSSLLFYPTIVAMFWQAYHI